jgi:hypothetical protein
VRLSLGSEAMKKILAAAIAVSALSTVAIAQDATRSNYFVAGNHQIYVWCTGGKGDKSVTVQAPNGEAAIKQAASAAGANCWGVWQGLAK